jgi:hypothetical protein
MRQSELGLPEALITDECYAGRNDIFEIFNLHFLQYHLRVIVSFAKVLFSHKQRERNSEIMQFAIWDRLAVSGLCDTLFILTLYDASQLAYHGDKGKMTLSVASLGLQTFLNLRLRQKRSSMRHLCTFGHGKDVSVTKVIPP